MEKLQATQILIQDAKLTAERLNVNETVTRIIDETQKRQAEILKLKEVNQESLRMVVQL